MTFHWPWQRSHDSGGTEARIDAERNLAKSVALRGEVRRIAQSLRELREENHFVERIDNLLQGRP